MALTQVSTQGIKDSTITGTDLATNVDLVDNQKLRLGNSQDLQIYHSGTHSFIQDTGTGNLEVSSSKVAINNAANNANMATFTDGGAVDLYHNGSKKLETVTNGISVAGRIEFTDTNSIITRPTGSALSIETGGTERLRVNSSGNVKLPDNGKLQFGGALNSGDGDLQIYHDGSNSYISEAGTGRLFINTNKFTVRNAASTENMINATENGAVELNYDNSKKFETRSGGVTVQGQLSVANTASGGVSLSVPDNVKAAFGTSDDLIIFHDGNNGNSHIKESGGGSLVLNADDLYLQNAAGTENLAVFVEDGAVELYHNGTKMIETTSTGTSIPDGKFAKFGASDDMAMGHNTYNYITYTGADFLITGDNTNQVKIMPRSDEPAAVFKPNAEVELYYDNTKRFETLSNGAQVQGRLAVGDDTAPETTFQVTATAAGSVYPMLLKNRTNGNASVGMRFIATGADLSDGDFASIEAGHGAVGSTNHEFRFKTCHSGTVAEKLRILSSGGITFNGDSATANALDDYEEGTFTPQLNGMGTVAYDARAGRYTKIGNVVYFQIRINLDTRTGGAHAHITNMPFTQSTATIVNPHCTFFMIQGIDLGGDRHPVAQFQNSEIYLYSVAYESSANYSAMDENQIADNSQWGVFGFYYTS